MIETWKLKRELRRIAEHVSAIPLLIYEPIFQKIYDKNIFKNLVILHGEKQPSKNIAIFLIYQPNGIPDSIFLTLSHLVKSDFSAVVISNCPISILDKERLRLDSFLIVERMNFGYDFGGYRDAVWLLRNLKIECDKMLFLNDSVWFPVFDNSKLLEQMLASDSDYVGTQEFGETETDRSITGFFGSYCFLINKKLIEDKAFNMFWDNYQLSSSKEIVLRRGERKFSREMIKASTKHNAIYSNKIFYKMVNELDLTETITALHELIALNPKIYAEKNRLINSLHKKESWLLRAKELIILQSKSKNFIGSSPLLSLNKLGFPMIKKNNEQLYLNARKLIIDSIDSGRLQGINETIESEIRLKS